MINFLKKIYESICKPKNKCACGKYNKCTIKTYSNLNGKLWFENKEFFSCGYIIRMIKSYENI